MERAKKTFPLFLLVLLTLGPASGLGQEERSGALTYGAEFDFNSRYIWRSFAWSEGAVWQPTAWLSRSGLTFSVWGNFVLNREPNYRRFNEVDFRLSYKKEWGAFTVEPAFNIYSYPNQDKAENPMTGELELQITYDLGLGGLSLETAHFLDLWENKGGYVGEVGIQLEQEAGANLILNAAARLTFANAKFNFYYVPLDKGAVSAFILELGLTYTFSAPFYIRPHFEWNSLLDGDLKAAVASSSWVSSGKSSLLNFGVTVGVEY
ncbi:MAG: hypothetical protein NTU60_00665 [Candidatus Aminicenantes bacterium]|nr:hypothetical protein [Candidatus Aminicenantes bacterium]